MDLASSSQRANTSYHRPAVSFACFVFVLLSLANPLVAADLAAQYLEGLRQRGWHDVVLDYLEHAAEDPIADSKFIDQVDFERAKTLVDLAREALQEKERQKLLDQATNQFRDFAASHPNSPVQLEALTQAGELLNEQALVSLSKADQLSGQSSSEEERLRSAARDTFATASEVLETLLKQCEKQLAELPKAAELQRDPEARAKNQRLQDWQAKAKLRLASIQFEESRTYPADSEEFSKSLADATEAFAELSEKYDGTRAGYFCLLFEGRCLQASEKFEKALDSYYNVIGQPSSDPNLRTLMARAYRRRAECFLATGKIDKAIDECRDWLSDARGDERQKPQWLAVAFRLTDAYLAKAKDHPNKAEANRLKSDARKLFREISKLPGEFQNHAKAALAATGEKIKPVATNSFGEALAAGKDALGRMNSSSLAVRLAAENNPDAVEDLKEQAEQNEKAAQQYFEKALRMVDQDTPIEDVLTVRYYLCWLYWQDQRFQETAVIGDYIARRYSDSKFASGAARLALAAYERLFNEAKAAGSNLKFESERLAAVAQLIVERWPDSEDASTAMNLLLNIALGDGKLKEAEQLLEKLPPDRRVAAQLSLGGSMWTQYLKLTSDNSGSISDEATDLKKRASEFLSKGYEQLRNTDNPSAAKATSVLYFVQLLLAQGESDQAVQVLEDPKVGPLSLISSKSSAGERPEFALETYKAALRAYVSVDPPQRESAIQMMEALEAAVGDKPDSQRLLTSIYVNLGLQLQQQINSLSAAGKTEKANAVAAAFEDLLKRITASVGDSGGNDWNIRIWIAQTNLQLGSGLRGDDAARYLEQAENIYSEILAQVKKDTNYAPNELAVLGIRKKLGDCLQSQKKFEQAYKQYTQILTEKSNLLELQQATASALQNWGTETGDISKLEQAIRGAMPQKSRQNLVWGWLKMSHKADQILKKYKRAANTDPKIKKAVTKYQDVFFEARFNAAKARFEAGKIAGGAEGKKHLGTAKLSVESMRRLYPDLGGPKWKQAFEGLLKEIEDALK